MFSHKRVCLSANPHTSTSTQWYHIALYQLDILQVDWDIWTTFMQATAHAY